MSTQTLSINDARQLIIDAFLASNVSEANALSTAEGLIAAELAGQNGHGLRRVPAYASQAKAGKVEGHAVPKMLRPRPAVLHIDGGHGFAFPALDMAIENIIPTAKEQGIAVAGIHRSHHAGVAGMTVERLAQQGLMAMFFTNAPAAMAPWGGNKAIYGTNPIAFAAPIAGGEPIVVDVSLSKVARGKIMAANQKKEPIPEGWALDPDGNPTTDAAQGLAGTMVPMGDAKGTALALMVEMLAAGLTGANFASEASSLFDDKGPPPGLGQLLIVIDPTAFGDSGPAERFALLASQIENQTGARVPGARRNILREKLLKDGIEVPDDLLRQIQALSSPSQS